MSKWKCLKVHIMILFIESPENVLIKSGEPSELIWDMLRMYRDYIRDDGAWDRDGILIPLIMVMVGHDGVKTDQTI